MLKRPSPVTITGDSVTWHFPTTLHDLVRLKEEHPQARIVAGNTEVKRRMIFWLAGWLVERLAGWLVG